MIVIVIIVIIIIIIIINYTNLSLKKLNRQFFSATVFVTLARPFFPPVPNSSPHLLPL